MVKARWTIIRVFQESPGAAPTSRCCAISMATSEVGSPLLTCLDSSAPLNHVGRRKFTSYRKRGKWRQHCVREDLSDRPNSFQNSRNLCYSLWASLVAQTVKNLPVTQEMQFWSLGQGDPPGEGNGYPLQYSCLENPMDRGAWWATAHRVAKSLKNGKEGKWAVCWSQALVDPNACSSPLIWRLHRYKALTRKVGVPLSLLAIYCEMFCDSKSIRGTQYSIHLGWQILRVLHYGHIKRKYKT